MAELKTKKNDASVMDFLNSVENDKRRSDALKVNELMTEISGEEPKMWGGSIVGYGSVHLKYASGRELDWMLTGFSPRQQSLSLYIMDGFKKYDELLSKLGKFKTGKSCLYVNKLEDVDMEVLKELIASSVDHMRSK
jgi:hypothetical protein